MLVVLIIVCLVHAFGVALGLSMGNWGMAAVNTAVIAIANVVYFI